MQVSQNYDDYLKYADLYEKYNPIVAQYCRMYYIQEQINIIKKKKNEQCLDPNDSIVINSILKRTEQVKEKINCTVEKRKLAIENEFNRMYQRIIQCIPANQEEKDCIRRKLLVLLDLIQILTVFAPLTQEWKNIGKFLTTSIENECKQRLKLLEKEKSGIQL